ncbi:MAG: hypothetical protein IKJ78_09790 [Bacteroidales bacterium]|nr:hypothetical protein [Bacteroidales bacterium]
MNKGKETITLVALLAAIAVIFRKTIILLVFSPNNAETIRVILTRCLGVFAVLFAISSIATLVLAWRTPEKRQDSLRERMQKTSWMRIIPFLLALVCFFYLQEWIYWVREEYLFHMVE